MRFTPLAASLIFLLCRLADAAPMLSFTHSPASLQNLSTGELVTINVELTELDANSELDSLTATIRFDGSLLGVPVIRAGPILPDPLDEPMDLVTAEDTGFADVAFLTFSANASDHVVTNGTFFSFDVTPVNVGSGMFTFDFSGATQFDGDGPIIVHLATGPPLHFSVVPEPTSFLASLILVAFAFVLHLRRRVTSNRCSVS